MRPCLKPFVRVVREGEHACYFMISERELFRCRGKTVPVLIDQVLPLLDGKNSAEEIGMALANTLPPQGIRDILQLLLNNHVAYNASIPEGMDAGDLEAYPGLLMFFGRFSPYPLAFLHALRRARVVVLGDSPLLLETATSLGACAFGAIDVLSPGPVAAIEAPPGTRLRQAGLEHLPESVRGAALVIGLQDGEFHFRASLREINRMCLETGTPSLLVRLTMDAEAWIGPVQVRGNACFECFENRIQSNLKTWKENLLFEEQIAAGVHRPARMELPLLGRQVAQIAALEAMQFVAGFDPTRLVGRCRVIDLLNQESSLHTVLRYPRCPACSQRRVERLYPWDADTIQLDRMLLPEGAAR